jgi:hypothetical protein
MRYQHSFAEERREPGDWRRSQRFTRFSPPLSPGNTLELVPRPDRRYSGAPSGYPPRSEDTETGSDGGATVTNAEGNTGMSHRPTPAAGNQRAPREKFFATLNLRRTST